MEWKYPFSTHFCTVSANNMGWISQYLLSYKMSIRDYSRRLFCNIKWWGLRCNPSCIYSSTDTGLFTRFMPTKYHHFACFRLSTYLFALFMWLYVRAYSSSADPGILLGGGGGSRPDCQKTVLTCFFFYSSTYFSFYRGCQMVISKKTIIFHGFRGGGNICQGVQLFPVGGGGGGGGRRGPNANFYRNPYNLWFSWGGVRTPYPLSRSAQATRNTQCWKYE